MDAEARPRRARAVEPPSLQRRRHGHRDRPHGPHRLAGRPHAWPRVRPRRPKRQAHRREEGCAERAAKPKKAAAAEKRPRPPRQQPSSRRRRAAEAAPVETRGRRPPPRPTARPASSAASASGSATSSAAEPARGEPLESLRSQGLNCPLPVLKARKRLDAHAPSAAGSGWKPPTRWRPSTFRPSAARRPPPGEHARPSTERPPLPDRARRPIGLEAIPATPHD